MNISLERAEGAVAGKLIVNIEKSDYQDKVAESLKNLKKKVQMPGFRKGMVPAGLIQKFYGNEVKAEEVQKVLTDAVNNYISDEKLGVIGEPMISDDNALPELSVAENFEFKFDLAFRPEINVEIDGNTVVDYYNMDVNDEIVDKQIEGYCRQNGKHIDADVYSEEDLLKGSLVENAEGENAVSLEEVSLMPRFFNNEEQKKLFESAKLNDKIVFNPSVAYEGRDAELASLLKLDKEEALKHNGEFTFEVKEISHFEPAEVDDNLIKAVYTDGSVKTVEEFKERVKADVEEQYKQDSDYKFMIDLRDVMMKKVGDIALAEDLLKKMVLLNAKTEETKKQVEEQFDNYLKDLRWSMVRNEIVKSLGVKIDDAQLVETSKRMVKIQMAQYGITNLPTEYLEQFASERLKDPKMHDTIVNNAIDFAIISAAKGVVKLNNKKVTVAEFNDLFK